jgi:hypothetical protein
VSLYYLPVPHTDTDTPGALFHRDGEWYQPTKLATGPWRTDAQHGGPPAALFGLAMSQAVEDHEHISRVTIELESPVPLEPLRVEVARRQVSRRVAHLDMALMTADRQVASARALLLAAERLPEPEWQPAPEDFSVPGPDKTYVLGGPRGSDDHLVFHRDGAEHRVVAGGYHLAGPSTAWIRLAYPLVDGDETTPLCSLLAAADFGSALSRPLSVDSGVGLINVDVSLALVRHPVGEWFRLEATGLVHPDGAGLAITHLADTQGLLGILHQSQLAQTRR